MIKSLIFMIVLLLSWCSINNTNNIINIEKEVDVNYRNILKFSKTGDYIHNIVLSPDKKTTIHTEYINDKWLKKEVVFKNWKKLYECNKIKSFYSSNSGLETESFKFSKDNQSLAFICENWTNNQVILNGKKVWDYQDVKSFLFDNKNNLIFWWKNEDKAFINIWWVENKLEYEYVHNIIISSKNELAYNVVKGDTRFIYKGEKLLNKYDFNEYPIFSKDGSSFSYKVWNIDDRKSYIIKDGIKSEKDYDRLRESFYWENNKLYTFVWNLDNEEICLLIDFKEKECFDNINLWGFKLSNNLNSYLYSIWDYWDEYTFVKDWYVWEKFHSIASYQLKISDNWESYWFWAEKEEWWESWIYKDWKFLNDDNYYFTNNLVYWTEGEFAYVWFHKMSLPDWKDKIETYIITNKNTYWPFDSYKHLEYGDNWELYFIVTNKDWIIEYNQWE